MACLDHNFDFLIIDTNKSSRSRAKYSLDINMCANDSLKLKIKEDFLGEIETEEGSIIQIEDESDLFKNDSQDSEADLASDEDDSIRLTFRLKMSGNFDEVNNYRLPLISHLKSAGFEKIYVIKDTVSEDIACKCYKKIYELENALRGYLMLFMSTTSLGPTWWEKTAGDEIKKKARDREKEIGTHFSQEIDNSAYSIDFSDLGKMIYSFSTEHNEKTDILKKIKECSEIEDFKSLQDEVLINIDKFFPKLKKVNFQEKWQEMTKVRNRVAHNGLFLSDHLVRCTETCDELLSVLEEESSGLIKISDDDLSFIASDLEQLTEEEFINILAQSEKFFQGKPGGYVGASHFINKTLHEKGYDTTHTTKILQKLISEGKVKRYERYDSNMSKTVISISLE